jgi:methylated-DNA-[protein]-cysteine S-methyltransferase
MASSNPTLTDPRPLVRWGNITSPLGRLAIAVSESGLCAVIFRRHEQESMARLESRAQLKRDDDAIASFSEQINEYFAGKRERFDLPFDLSALTPFQRRALTVTARIPFGEVFTYRQVAIALKRPKSSRPVGQALGRNPIPIVIPCHRVIASDGGLGGYCGTTGLELKHWLLRHEGVRL